MTDEPIKIEPDIKDISILDNELTRLHSLIGMHDKETALWAKNRIEQLHTSLIPL